MNKENIFAMMVIVFFAALFVVMLSYFFNIPWWACVLFVFLFLNLIILLGISKDLTNIKYVDLFDIKQDIAKIKNKAHNK